MVTGFKMSIYWHSVGRGAQSRRGPWDGISVATASRAAVANLALAHSHLPGAD